MPISELRSERYHAGSATHTDVAAPNRDASSTSTNGKNLRARKVVQQLKRWVRCSCLASNSSNKKPLESRKVAVANDRAERSAVSSHRRLEGSAVSSHLPLERRALSSNFSNFSLESSAVSSNFSNFSLESSAVSSHLPHRHSTKAIVERVQREGVDSIIRELCNWRSGSIDANDIFQMKYFPTEPQELRVGEHIARVIEMKSQDVQPFSYSGYPCGLDGVPALQVTGMVVAAQYYFEKYGTDIKFLDTSCIRSTVDHENISALVKALVTSLESLSVNKAVGVITPSHIGRTLNLGHVVPLLITKTGHEFLEIINLDSTPNHRSIKIAPALELDSEEIRHLSDEEKVHAISVRNELICGQNVMKEEYGKGYLPEIITNKLRENFSGVSFSELSTGRQVDSRGCRTDAIFILKEALRNGRDDPSPAYRLSDSGGDPKLKPSMLKTSQRSAFMSSQDETGSTIISAEKKRTLSDHKKVYSLEEDYLLRFTIDGAGKDALLKKLEGSDKVVHITDAGEHFDVESQRKDINRFLRIKTIRLAEQAMLVLQGEGADPVHYIDDKKDKRIISSVPAFIQ